MALNFPSNPTVGDIYTINGESWQWNGWGITPPVWTVIMLLIAGLITHFVTLPRLDFAYAGVFIWGVIAIAVKNSDIVLISGTAIGLSIS